MKASFLSGKGLLAGLTLIHIINLVHLDDTQSKAAAQISDCGDDTLQWMSDLDCSGSAPPQISLSALLCLRERIRLTLALMFQTWVHFAYIHLLSTHRHLFQTNTWQRYIWRFSNVTSHTVVCLSIFPTFFKDAWLSHPDDDTSGFTVNYNFTLFLWNLLMLCSLTAQLGFRGTLLNLNNLH